MTRTLPLRRLPAILLASGMVTAGAHVIGAGATPARSQPPGVCVRDVGDLNADGQNDYAMSRSAPDHPVVFIVHGEGQVPAIDDLQHGRRRPAVVMRGLEAEPFLCSEVPAHGTSSRATTFRQSATALAGTASVGPVARPPSYTVVDLDPLMPGFGDGYSSVAAAINSRGEVVGRFSSATGDRAYRYAQGVVHDLGTLGGHESAATGINEAGDVVGYSLTGDVGPAGFVNAAFRSRAGVMENLGLSWGDARAVSGSGRVVGAMRFVPASDELTAFSLGDAGPVPLGYLPLARRPSSVALAINASGRIVGESASRLPGVTDPDVLHPSVHPVVFENGVARDLGFLGRSCYLVNGGAERCIDRGSATAITDRGLIVGFSSIERSTHAFVTDGGALIDLGTLDGDSTFAYGANESGQVVGSARPTGPRRTRAFLYDGGVMYDLETLVDGAVPITSLGAYAINDFGVIALQHHVLTPNYDSVADGRPLSFDATLGSALTFEYWAADLRATPCDTAGPRLEARFSAAATGAWTPAAVIADCRTRTWRQASVPVPPELQGSPARVELRLEGAAGGSERLHLRRFRTQ